MMSGATRTNNQEINGYGWIGEPEQGRARIAVRHNPPRRRFVQTSIHR